ncbi:MAG: beta-propeller domain-containing protein [Clostridia bacterium]|nr:beta-propeller domain-containing protein [Clostridia bacterium]
MFKGAQYNGLNMFQRMLLLPWSLMDGGYYGYDYGYKVYNTMDMVYEEEAAVYDLAADSVSFNESAKSASREAAQVAGKGSDDFSKTNIQVENVDEADYVKTDGKYIYAVENNYVYVIDPSKTADLRIVKKIDFDQFIYPEDLLINEGKLVIIGRDTNGNSNTFIDVYDTEKFEKIANYVMEGDYNTSRMIGSRLITVTRQSYWNHENRPVCKIGDKVLEVPFENFFYNPKLPNYQISIVSTVDLNDKDNFNVYGISTDSGIVYVSEKYIYLMNEYYGYEINEGSLAQIFGFKGIFGYEDFYTSNDWSAKTDIVKIKMAKNNELKLDKETVLQGSCNNQFSFDEKDGHLRIVMDDSEDNDSSKVVILDESLNKIGELGGIAPGENIYSSRFVGDRLYLVTFKTMDPLFVIDLSNERKPKVLGELKIPGYSSYIHPYDDDHIIGIGIEAEEITYKDSFGRITSTTYRPIGLKMAMFDVSDVENPKEISKAIIGDNDTTSQILSNHKALLFSKEKELLAIPVTDYEYGYGYEISKDANIDEYVNVFANCSKGTTRGLAVYKVNLDGIKFKGNIYHPESKDNYWRYDNSVRGLFIGEDLFTISDKQVKVNKLDTLREVSTLNLK